MRREMSWSLIIPVVGLFQDQGHEDGLGGTPQRQGQYQSGVLYEVVFFCIDYFKR